MPIKVCCIDPHGDHCILQLFLLRSVYSLVMVGKGREQILFWLAHKEEQVILVDNECKASQAYHAIACKVCVRALCDRMSILDIHQLRP